MNDTFEDFVVAEKIDGETLVHALRYYVSEVADYVPPNAMHAQLAEVFEEESDLKRALDALENRPDALDALVTAVLSAAWGDPTERGRIRGAIEHAQTKLPVVEVTILATTALYGLWLLKTGGAKAIKERREIRPDGSQTIERLRTNYAFSDPLRSLLERLGLGRS
jgi:hypothetical protein